MNYLKTGTLLPVFDNDPNDIKIVYNALKAIDLQKKSSAEETCVIDVQDCGAAYRFLMAVLAATPGNWILTGTSRLLQRPILPLVNFLNAHGANIEKMKLGWRIEGVDLEIDDFGIDTSETSQFASAIMMLGWGCLKSFFTTMNTKISTKNINIEYCFSNFCELCGNLCELCGNRFLTFKTAPCENQNPYIKMTETIINCGGVAHNIPTLSDWSAALFWLANALLKPNAHYLLKNLHFDGLQGDAEIVPYFKKWGLSFTENEHGIEVKHAHNIEIPAQKIDVTQMPDTAMVLAVLSVCYPFELTMSGLKNLNLKESNRLDILVNELSKFTLVIKHSEEVITIYKRTEELPKMFHFDSYNDHRFVMAWSLFRNFGTVDIENPECVKKSYPEFKYL